jgi:hypothetical protein
MPTYLLIKCSGVSPVLVHNTAGFVSRSFWDILCSICVTGVRTTSKAAWVNWPLKKIWADHLICSMTAHNVTCGGVHACCIVKCGLSFAQNTTVHLWPLWCFEHSSVKRTFPDGRSMGNYNVLTIIHAQIFWFADYPCMTSDESEKLIFF